MGLDQYARAVKSDYYPDLGAFQFEDKDELVELAYWRKHPNLQGWMEELYRSRGGEGDFNCVYLKLTSEDLDALEEAVQENDLPETVGFFFGQSRPEDRDSDLEFIRKAREAIANGYTVYYNSWW